MAIGGPKKSILKISTLTTRWEVREVLGSAGFYHPNFAESAKPLYEVTKEKESFQWMEVQKGTFNRLKQTSLMAPALGLPDITQPLQPYTDKGKDISHSTVRPLGSPSSTPSKEIRPCALCKASLFKNYHLHSLASQGCEQTDSGQALYITTPRATEGVLRPQTDG